jgi:YebC/PmpR family DNA-binding regulatory protein
LTHFVIIIITTTCTTMKLSAYILIASITASSSFTIQPAFQNRQNQTPFTATTAKTTPSQHTTCHRSTTSSVFPLFMGRAAAVRAATKSKTDAKKAKMNAFYGKKIIMAVKQGGSSDPAGNRQLADVMRQAKANSVPVDNINRAIKKASEANTGDFSESTFEAYGHGGASFIVNVLSDNANRASADVKSTINKKNGKVAESGSVLFMYDRKGVCEVDGVVDELELMDAAVEAGCDDMEVLPGDEEGTSIVYTDPKEASLMVEALNSIGFEDKVKMKLAYVSKAPVECSEEDFEKNMAIVDALEELDDVDSVEHNMSN